VPLDLEVINLNPNLVGHRDADLIRQVVSNSIHNDQISNATEIVALSSNSSLRRNIILALGRRHNEDAQQALRTIFDRGITKKEQALVIGSIKPKSLDDPGTDWILDKLNSNELSDSLNRQILSKLLIVSRYEGIISPDAPSRLLTKIDTHWHGLLQEVYQSNIAVENL